MDAAYCPPPSPQPPLWRRWLLALVPGPRLVLLGLQLLALAVLVLLCGLLFWWATRRGYTLRALELVYSLGWWGAAALTGGIVLTGLPFVPGCALLILALGYLYGFVVGFVATTIGFMLGAHFGFWAVRLLLRSQIEAVLARSRPELVYFVQQLGAHELKFLLLVRLIPLMFGLQNSLCAVSPVRYVPYTLVTAAISIPEQALYVYVGTTVLQIQEIVAGTRKPSLVEYAMMAVGISAVLLAFLFIAIIGKQTIQQARRFAAEQQPADEPTPSSSDQTPLGSEMDIELQPLGDRQTAGALRQPGQTTADNQAESDGVHADDMGL